MADELNVLAFLSLEPDKGSPIEGEAQDATHKGELQVISFSFGVTNPKAASAGDSDSKPDFQEITVQLVPSKASPALFLAAARGDHFKKATLSVKKHGTTKTNTDYVQLQLCDVYISSYSAGHGDGPRPTEAISLTFATIDFYHAQQEQDGTLKQTTKRAWSINDNKDIPSQLPYTPKKGS
jgi:type VI secretion system secreted protein Hcp